MYVSRAALTVDRAAVTVRAAVTIARAAVRIARGPQTPPLPTRDQGPKQGQILWA